MKTLDKMTNVEKAVLLHGLFPDEIPELLKCIKGMLEAIEKEEPKPYIQWDSGLFSSVFRKKILDEARDKMKRYGNRMRTCRKLFAEQLFDGYLIFCSVYCLKAYARIRKMYNPKFTAAVDLLYDL